MVILGVTAPASWNTAAALIKDGQLVAAAEEERFLRLKHAPNLPPLRAASWCLNAAGITMDQVDLIAVGWRDPASYLSCSLLEELRSLRLPGIATGVANAFEYLIQLTRMQKGLNSRQGGHHPRWVFVPHHIAHAASAYYASGFDAATVLTLDGNGEDDSGWLGTGRGLELMRSHKIRPQQSLGVLYGNVTGLLGFKEHSQEGKTMGLSAWGKPGIQLEPHLSANETHYRLDRRYIRWLKKKFPRRPAHEPLSDQHKDLAFAVQAFLERAGVSVAKRAYADSKIGKFCLAGGVTLNCDMNAKIIQQPFVEEMFVQPAAHDAGVALGAAYVVAAETQGWKPSAMTHAAWGPGYIDAEIEPVLREAKAGYTRCNDIADAAADLLAKGKIVGWFQGRMEWGPRALGNRSILAHPGMPEMKDKVNIEVKHREPWRPFAPSILHEAGPDWVENYKTSPFMLVTFTVKPNRRKDLAAATHVDHTVRTQSVVPEANPVYHRLIERFCSRTGIPAVLNTSFNDEGEPLVMSPRDALRTYSSTGLDALAIGSFLLVK
ncbi:MAG: carbamoyltransferase [Candidatus Omnitrophica bacterium]|nr:carbamoyltransferase [Candidatus Omnitrophota bacterium]